MQNQEFQSPQSGSKPSHRPKRHLLLFGIVLLVIGAVLMMRQVNRNLIPDWVFTWPMILIVVGIFVGLQTRFRDIGWLILVGVGSFFLADKAFPDYDAGRFIIPGVVCIAGIVLLISAGRKRPKQAEDYNPSIFGNRGDNPLGGIVADELDATAIFGNVKKVIYNKDFKGGEVVAIFGGAEINLSQADMKGPIILEIVQIFGGTKLIVPPDWEIRSEAVAIFGGIEDKRPRHTVPTSNKVIILQGTAIFAGIEIKSY